MMASMQHTLRSTIYDVQWQAIRVSLLGGFVDNIKCGLNLIQLRGYLDRATGDERTLRLYRINNLLAGTRMGFHGMGIVGSAQDKLIVAFQENISKQYSQLNANDINRAVKSFNENYEERTLAELAVLKKEDPDTLDLIYQNLIQRTKQAHKKVGGTQHRPELEYFIQLIKHT